jgi:hypothetical protein
MEKIETGCCRELKENWGNTCTGKNLHKGKTCTREKPALVSLGVVMVFMELFLPHF